MKIITKHSYKITLFSVFVLAIFLRLFQLEKIPNGALPQEALNANNLSLSIEEMRFWSSILSVIFIIFLYIASKKIFLQLKYKKQQSDHLSLLTLFLVSTSFWHIELSRTATKEALLYSFILFFLYIPLSIILFQIYQKIIIRLEKYRNHHRFKIVKKEIIFMIFISLFFSSYYQIDKYFDKWTLSEKTANEFNYSYKKIAEKLSKIPSEIDKFVIINTDGEIINGLPIESQIIKLFSKNKDIIYVMKNEIENIKIQRDSIIIPIDQNIEIFKEINEKKPNGLIKVKDGILFYVLYKN